MLRGVSEIQANTFAIEGTANFDSDTFTLLSEGVGYFPGLIVPSVILMAALLGVAVLLIVTRQSGGRRDEDG